MDDQTANVRFTDDALSLVYYTSAARTKRHTRGVDGRVLQPAMWETLIKHTICVHGIRFAGLDALAILKTKALATRGDHQALKITTDIQDIEACLLHMAQSGLSFDSELAVFCEEAHVTKLINVAAEMFVHLRKETLLRHMRATNFPHYKPSHTTAGRNVSMNGPSLVVSCAVLGVSAYYLYKICRR